MISLSELLGRLRKVLDGAAGKGEAARPSHATCAMGAMGPKGFKSINFRQGNN